jgi:hypothetical protein
MDLIARRNQGMRVWLAIALSASAVLGGARPARAQALTFNGPAHSGTDCAGCTTGGLSCFGKNACDDGCMSEYVMTCDTCDIAVAPMPGPACCTGCATPCSPNQPCSGKINRFVSNTCPTIAPAPAGCQYYALIEKCVSHEAGRRIGCKYYALEAPVRCITPPHPSNLLLSPTLDCIRQCLQITDALLHESGAVTECPKTKVISDYHDACFASCGAPDIFPSTLFQIFGNTDD